MHSPWGLLLLVTLGGAQAWGGPRHGRFSAPLHRPTLSPGRGLQKTPRNREALRVGKLITPEPVREHEPPPAGEIAGR